MNTLKRRARSFTALLAILAAVPAVLTTTRPASAQAAGSGVLTGNVTDAADKKPVADAIVTATSPDLQGEQVVVTDSAGFFRIPDLPSGTYALRFEKDGYSTVSRDKITLRADSTLRLNAPLLPTSLKAEEVAVVGRAPVVDVGSSSVGGNITSEFTKRVPVASPNGKGGNSRSFEAVA